MDYEQSLTHAGVSFYQYLFFVFIIKFVLELIGLSRYVTDYLLGQAFYQAMK